MARLKISEARRPLEGKTISLSIRDLGSTGCQPVHLGSLTRCSPPSCPTPFEGCWQAAGNYRLAACAPHNQRAARKVDACPRKNSVALIRRFPSSCTSSSEDRKSTRLNSSHRTISYAVFCLKKK